MPTLRALPLLLFLILLVHPWLLTLAGLGTAPLRENRVLTAAPVAADYFGDGKLDWLGYAARWNGWFTDQFPLRAPWVRTRNQVLYSVFGESDKVHIGSDGWLFYRSLLDRELPSLERIVPDPELPAMVARIERLGELLTARGISLYVLPLTTKNYYFPELLPTSAQHAKRFRFYDLYVDALLASEKVHTIDPRAALTEAKRNGVKVFHHTDMHWTDPASIFAFKRVLQALGAEAGVGDPSTAWQHELLNVPRYQGGEANALPLWIDLGETTIDVRLLSPQLAVTRTLDVVGLEFTQTPNDGQPLPPLAPVLVFGDSFFDAADRTGFFNFFQGTARARLFGQTLVDAYRQRLPGTRYLIIGSVGSGTFGLDNNVAELIAALEADSTL